MDGGRSAFAQEVADAIQHGQAIGLNFYQQLRNGSDQVAIVYSSGALGFSERVNVPGVGYMPGILWNPEQGLMTPDGGGQSPANGIWHEIGHLFDYLGGVQPERVGGRLLMPFNATPAYVESEFARAYGEGLRAGETEGDFYPTRAGVTSFWGQ